MQVTLIDKRNFHLFQPLLYQVASGSITHYFGQDKWADSASGLKTVEDATSIRSKILSAFEKAELEEGPDKKVALLTFAIIGGGPAGVEMAGAIAEIARHTLQGDFHNINSSQARIILIEGNERILSMYPPELSQKAENTLQKLDVNVWTKHFVNNIDKNRISLNTTNDELELEAETIIWAAGVILRFPSSA